ncbi:unnamed protein product [Prorocentrum cordatum]|uniref:Uncharacterized protein n=1 Tax=Prorocentrum cordatum TaxID=2364126 RepID=A0ABN9U1B1_9DINO|nr:unnamed protein product [Polarella glacialis]
MSLGAGANAAYRALQRACRRADERPERLVALLARPPRLFVPRAGKPLRLAPPRWPFVEDALYDAIGGSTEFAHPKPPGCRAAAASARRHRARVEALGAEYPPEAAEVLRRLGEAALVEAIQELEKGTAPAPPPTVGAAKHAMEQAQWQCDRAVAKADGLEVQLREAQGAVAEAYHVYEHCENVYKKMVRGLAAKVVPVEQPPPPLVPRISLDDMLQGKDIDFDDKGRSVVGRLIPQKMPKRQLQAVKMELQPMGKVTADNVAQLYAKAKLAANANHQLAEVHSKVEWDPDDPDAAAVYQLAGAVVAHQLESSAAVMDLGTPPATLPGARFDDLPDAPSCGSPDALPDAQAYAPLCPLAPSALPDAVPEAHDALEPQPDAPPNAPFDALLDAVPEAHDALEPQPDAPPNAASDARLDALPDAPPFSLPDALPDAQPYAPLRPPTPSPTAPYAPPDAASYLEALQLVQVLATDSAPNPADIAQLVEEQGRSLSRQGAACQDRGRAFAVGWVSPARPAVLLRERLAAQGKEAMRVQEADAVELPALRRLPPTDASRVDVGDILVAHPLACLQQPELTQSVMLVICVDDSSNHVRAVALNTPPRGSLRTLLASIPFSDADKQALERLGPLLDLHASPGGDLSSRKLGMHLHWLHGLGPAAATGCHEVLPSVWLGGEPAPQMAASIPAAAGAPAGSTPTRLRPVVGYAGWSRAQLAVELERGVWARCRAESPEAARALCLPGSLPRVAASAPGWQACAWRAALRAAGLQPLANFPRGGGADAPLIKLLHAHRKTMFETEVAAAQQAAAL